MEDPVNTGTRSGGIIVALVPDVFFSVTVRNTIRRIGFDPRIVTTITDLVQSGEDGPVVLAIVDISAVGDQSTWVKIGGLARDGVPVLAFGPHRDVEGLRNAKDAGVTRVVANSQFHREMADLIMRYARGVRAG
jgi:hypothetical protein